MSIRKLILASILVASIISCSRQAEHPNVIYILADDMGYGDVSALNADSKIITPNMDRLANEGMIFTDAHSGSAVCTPTRYGILTGRYSWRTRLKSGVTWSWDTALIENDRLTVAAMLKEKGYSTACIGKWHLGLGWTLDSTGAGDFSKPLTTSPNDNGFDYSYIITASLDIPPYVYFENGEITALPDRMTEDKSKFGWWRLGHTGADFRHDDVLPNFTDRAVSWINEQAQAGEKPFFLYLPLAAPHTPILPTGEFKGISNTNPYGDFVVMVDHMIGRITDAVEKNGISDNTIIIISSDNGCSPQADYPQLAEMGHHPSYVYRGHKADIFEGGHRVPFIVRWPGRISPGSSSDQLICLTDLMATMAEITGYDIPDNAAEDSFSFLGSLTGDATGDVRSSVVHHSVNGFFALRTGDWKLNVCAGSGGWSYPTENVAKELELPWFQLYNLNDDVNEQNNLAEQYPERVEEIKSLLMEIIENGRSTPGSRQINTPAQGWPQNKLRY
jgi:arylsulfatase A-like enzyme